MGNTAPYGVPEDIICEQIGRMKAGNLCLGTNYHSSMRLVQLMELGLSRRIRSRVKKELKRRGRLWLANADITPDADTCAHLIYRLALTNQEHHLLTDHAGLCLCDDCEVFPWQGILVCGDNFTCVGQCYRDCVDCSAIAVELEIDRYTMKIGELVATNCVACERIGFAKLLNVDSDGECDWELA